MPAPRPDGHVRFLVSYWYYKDRDLSEFGRLTTRPVRLMSDSGAYSAFTQRSGSVVINVADYAAWLADWRPLLTTMINLDVIGDPKASAVNQLALEERGFPVIPVWHGSSSWAELEALCRDYRYVAMGGTAALHGRRQAMTALSARACLIAREHGTVLHGLGRSGSELADIPFYSVDNTTWMRSAMFGRFTVFDDRAHTLKIIDVPAAARQPRVLRAHGVDPAIVSRSDFAMLGGRPDVLAYRAEKAAALRCSAVAWLRYEAWLRARHRVPAPPGLDTPGTVTFFAEDRPRHLRQAVAAANFLDSPGTVVFFADNRIEHLAQAAAAAQAAGGEEPPA